MDSFCFEDHHTLGSNHCFFFKCCIPFSEKGGFRDGVREQHPLLPVEFCITFNKFSVKLVKNSIFVASKFPPLTEFSGYAVV